ncbi:MAG TPA: RnfABCDGE type electron transport complex subunit G, partial [Candidatus Competibacter phosphatis]|nr:RnfABCDGE type electron transport complex subunit G [Candidatus Competibacter phosphatis]
MISHWLKPEIRQSSGYPILLLGGVALLVSTAIGIANFGTHADIAQRQLEDLQATLQQVIPAKYYDNDPVRDTVTVQEGDRSVRVYRARLKGQVQAVSFRTTAPGYGSTEMVMIIGVDRDGKLLGVRVISHAETPGLGDKIETSKSDWVLSFNGR